MILVSTHIVRVDSQGNVFEGLLFAIRFHQPPIDRPELIELVVDQTQPELIVVLLLHGGYDQTAVLQHIRLLQAGHVVRFQKLPKI